jgi:hypothetical protein
MAFIRRPVNRKVRDFHAVCGHFPQNWTNNGAKYAYKSPWTAIISGSRLMGKLETLCRRKPSNDFRVRDLK